MVYIYTTEPGLGVNALKQDIRNNLAAEDTVEITADTTRWESLLSSTGTGTRYTLPAGTYRINDTITAVTDIFQLVGESRGVVTFEADFAGPMFDMSNGCGALFRNIKFRNLHADGGGLYYRDSAQGGRVQGCDFECGNPVTGTGVGLVTENAKSLVVFDNRFHDCGLGASLHGHTRIKRNSFIDNFDGLRLTHIGTKGSNLWFEGNANVALMCGREYLAGNVAGQPDPIGNFDLRGMTFLDNAIAIYFDGGSKGTMANFSIYGLEGTSDDGIYISSGGRIVTLTNFRTRGSFANAAFTIDADVLAETLTGWEFANASLENLVDAVNDPAKCWTKMSGAVRTQLYQDESTAANAFYRTNCEAIAP